MPYLRSWSAVRDLWSQNPNPCHQHQLCSHLLTCPINALVLTPCSLTGRSDENNTGVTHALDYHIQSCVATFDTALVSSAVSSVPSQNNSRGVVVRGSHELRQSLHNILDPGLCPSSRQLVRLIDGCLWPLQQGVMHYNSSVILPGGLAWHRVRWNRFFAYGHLSLLRL